MSSPQIGHLAVRFVDPEKPRAKEPQKRARNVVAPDRPPGSTIRRSGKTYGQRAPLKGSKCRRPSFSKLSRKFQRDVALAHSVGYREPRQARAPKRSPVRNPREPLPAEFRGPPVVNGHFFGGRFSQTAMIYAAPTYRGARRVAQLDRRMEKGRKCCRENYKRTRPHVPPPGLPPPGFARFAHTP